MKTIISLLAISIFSIPGFANTKQNANSKYRCECFQNVPFEGYIIYVVETTNNQESWLTLESAPTNYGNLEECKSEISQNKTCEYLSGL